MSLLKLTQRLANVAVSTNVNAGSNSCITSSHGLFSIMRSCYPAMSVPTSEKRHFHQSCQCHKNFRSKIPRDLKIGLYRLPSDVDPNKYTTEAIETAKTGGRGPDGRIWIHKIGGGYKRKFRMIDFKRSGPKEGDPLIEKVFEVRKDDWRSASIALVAEGNNKRWILASENMKAGDLIKSSGVLTTMPVRAQEGDAHPVGSLPIGTLVHNIEPIPGEGGLIARSAGTSGVFIRKLGDKCVIRMPSKREMVVSQDCMVTVGKVSNVDHIKTKKMKTAGENRQRGRRPHSGWWQRKTGYAGRKINPIKPAVVHESVPENHPQVLPFTF